MFLCSVMALAGLTAGSPALPADSLARVTVVPARPEQGSLVQLVVRPGALGGADSLEGTHTSAAATGLAIAGEVGGEPLHFERDADGAFRALAAVPIDAPDTLRVALVLARGDASDTLPVAILVRRATYPVERLRVAPKFGEPPDSALAARIAAEGALARDASRRSHETPRMWRGTWLRPRPTRITSSFGRGREFNGVVQSRHMGTDFAGAVGAPVRAANRGVVALVVDFYLAGKAVYVDHGEGLVTGYFHLSEARVAQGDTVSRGQLVGRVGASGRVTGPHLHWIARYGTVSVNPMGLLRIDERERLVIEQ